MARPKNNGLDYFPFDVDFFSDRKIKRLKARYGSDGISVYIYLICEIYRSGYYIDLNDDLILDISDELNISENSTRQIVDFLLSRSLFDDTLAKSDKVLTATSIQRRFQEAKKASKRAFEVERKLWLLKAEDTYSFIKVRQNESFSKKNPSFSEKNTDKSEKNSTNESKVKESKVNKSKVNIGAMPDALQTALSDFIKMRKVIKKPLTDNALQRLINKLYEMSADTDTQIAILNQSTDHCWQDLYELKIVKSEKTSEHNYSIDDFEKYSLDFLSQKGAAKK